MAAAPPGSVIGVATEIHLVKRLDDESPGQDGGLPRPAGLPLLDHVAHRPAHLAWILEGLVDGEVRNRIVVDADTAEWARVALERMLAITLKSHPALPPRARRPRRVRRQARR